MNSLLSVFWLSMIPVSELRAAVPAGILAGFDPLAVYITAVVGNLFPVPFIMLFLRSVLRYLRRVSPKFEAFVERFESRIRRKADQVQNYEFLGLLLFVAIPLPGTGAWTGAAIASFLDMRMKYAIPMIFGGLLISGAIMTIVTLTGTSIAGS